MSNIFNLNSVIEIKTNGAIFNILLYLLILYPLIYKQIICEANI